MRNTNKQIKLSFLLKVVSIISIGLFLYQIAVKTSYPHVHKLADGSLIMHAHPYDKSKDSEPYKSHSHSNCGFIFLENLKVSYLVLFMYLILGLYISFIYIQKVQDALVEPLFLLLANNKAPPVIFL